MSKNERYAELSDNIVDMLGGKSNVTFVTHCYTRLRFNVKDKSLVRKDEVDGLDGVLTSQWSGDQYQVVVGQAVADAYKLICEKHGFEQADAVDENLDGAPAKKRFSIVSVFEAVAGCVTPLIAILSGAGLLKVLVLLLEQIGILTPGDPTDLVLSFVGDAGFYFLPIFVGAAAAKRFKTSVPLGMLVGAMMIHPNFIKAVAEGAPMSFFGIPVPGGNYANQILPTIIAVWVMAPIQRFFARKSPEMIRSIVEPLCTLIIMIPLTLCLIAPAGMVIGKYVADAIMWFHGVFGAVGVAVLAALMPWLVMTGMHAALMPYAISQLATVGFENVMVPAMLINNLNQGIASLAVSIKSRTASVKSTALSCFVSATIGGITEPAMYGINLKYRTPMYACMAGSFAGGLVAGLGNASAFVVNGAKGIFGFPAYLGADLSNFTWILGAAIVGAIVTFAVAFVTYKPVEE